MDDLSDLEINGKIATITDVVIEHITGNTIYIVDNIAGLETGYDEYMEYNPLQDDALCFQLMVKYDMPPMKSGCGKFYECVFDMDRALSGAGIICDESPNKAICLAIIEAHNE